MDILQSDSGRQGHLPNGIQASYPVPPLSWLAPLWSYACGVIASSAAIVTNPSGVAGFTGRTASGLAGYGGSALLFMLGLLLAGPLLGTTWGASRQIRYYRGLATDSRADPSQASLRAIPYTLPGSPSHALASWLGACSTWLQHAAPVIGMAPQRLAAGTVFSLVLAAELGQRTLALTAAALLYIGARSLGREPETAHGDEHQTPAPAILPDIFFPMVITWLIGHATYAALRIESVLVAASFALTVWGSWYVHRMGKGLLHLLLPQALVMVFFIVDQQPVPAAGLALLASAPLLWSSLLTAPGGRTRFLRALQLPLAMAMLLSAWALGYGP